MFFTLNCRVCSASYMDIFWKSFILPPLIFLLIQGITLDSSSLCHASSHPELMFYKGAVVEFAPHRLNQNEKGEEIILRNTKRYLKIIAKAGKENANIIVFPECGLTSIEIPIVRDKMATVATFIPDVEENTVPCSIQNGKIAQHLQELSCAAIESNIFVVFNLEEKVKCDRRQPNCPTDGLLFYNTNVVFDNKGKLIAKYRKFNLFVEPETNITSTAELVTFDTDFGVRFGMFICFDILFDQPALKIIEETKVQNIVYSTAWFSELPHLTAAEIQAGYSYSQNINLLASGYSRPDLYNTGSGIYSGERGPLVVVMSEESTTKLLIAKVPINPNKYVENTKCNENEYYCDVLETKIFGFEEDDYLIKSLYDENKKSEIKFYHEDLSNFTSVTFGDSCKTCKNEKSEGLQISEFKYDLGGFQCEMTVKWEKDKNWGNNGPIYRLLGYSGKRSYAGLREVDIEVCSIIACQSDDLSTCGHQPNFELNNLINIKSVYIHVHSTKMSNPYAVTLDKNILPLSGGDISYHQKNDVNSNGIECNMILEKPHNDLITFGIYKTK